MAGISNSSETLTRVYKAICDAQDAAFNTQQTLYKQMSECSQSWNDDKYKEFAELIRKSGDELKDIVIALGTAAEKINDLKARLTAYEEFKF